MRKVVEYEGKKYTLTFGELSGDSVIRVNGESSKILISNSAITDIETFKKFAKSAINAYNERRTAVKKFEEWDGKL